MKEIIKPEIEQEVLSLITDISFANVPSWYGATRRDLRMDLIVPKSERTGRKLPVILWFCGGAYRVMDKSVWMPELMFYARHGFVVASAQYRTSNEATFPEPLSDGKAAVRYLKAHADEFGINPDRIIVMGESAGGTMATLLGVTSHRKELDKGDYLDYDSSVCAVVDYYGIGDLTDITCHVTNDTPAWTIQDYLGIAYTEEDAARASAIHYVTEDTPPMILFHGDEDVLVPISQSKALYEKLQECDVTSEFYTIQGAGHGADAFYQTAVKEKVLQFLQKITG